MKVLVIADIHGNAEALRAVLDNEAGIDQTLFLGDTAYPCPQVQETIDLLKTQSGVFIRGNHDEMALNPELLQGRPEPWRILYEAIYKNIDQSYFDYIRDYESGGQFHVDGIDICLQHGYVHGKIRHVLPSASDELLKSVARGVDCPITLFGHSHVQFRRKIENREFINPGSVGQNRCGHLLACYGVLTDGMFEHRQVEYDPRPLYKAFDQIKSLDKHDNFRDWLKESIRSGFGVGRQEPWVTFAAQGYF